MTNSKELIDTLKQKIAEHVDQIIEHEQNIRLYRKAIKEHQYNHKG